MTLRAIFYFFLVVSSAIVAENEGLGDVPNRPSESECRPYIEKALQGAGTHDTEDQSILSDTGDHLQTSEINDDLEHRADNGNLHESEKAVESVEVENLSSEKPDLIESVEVKEEQSSNESTHEDEQNDVLSKEEIVSQEGSSDIQEPPKNVDSTLEASDEEQSTEQKEIEDSNEGIDESIESNAEEKETTDESQPKTEEKDSLELNNENPDLKSEESPNENVVSEKSEEDNNGTIDAKSLEDEESSEQSIEVQKNEDIIDKDSKENETVEDTNEEKLQAKDSKENETIEDTNEEIETISIEEKVDDQTTLSNETKETDGISQESESVEIEIKEKAEDSSDFDKNEEKKEVDSPEIIEDSQTKSENEDVSAIESQEAPESDSPVQQDEKSIEAESPEEELIMEIEIPKNLRSREHMPQILRLNLETAESEKTQSRIADSTLRELKKLYDAAIKPLEILYKYRDLSNRHFGDPEIFSKPLILFMGPWSGGKSTIINYLLENEYKKTALRTGAEPSPAYFNIVMWGEQEEVLDGTQLAADWTFSGLQKFGQGLLDRLRGHKLNHPLLEKVNIVEIPGILEIRKQVERLFPFNDACQWFIDRADIIFLVYDPSKLDVGPESEAILDQLKGREMQTKIILNKADQVRPEELMRVQGTLIWNISPLMSSTEPPVMYSTSLWSLPYESGAPTRLLYAQERAFLSDLREAITKRVENKIASARRFAVRVRNHAKMVDCYLTTYYNHKSFFGNKKKVSDDIIEHPQNYHIYEGLSTLTNISRYDLPDPDVYKDFFRLNPVYEFQQLSSTCTYFRGCPINRLDIAIAYDLPELVGKYKKSIEEYLNSKK